MIVRGLLLVSFALSVVTTASAKWQRDRIWKDGRAEVVVYDSNREIYGKGRRFREQIIVVPEDLRVDTLVKADHPKKQKTIRVFKMNVVQKIDTKNYPYSYMGSVFVDAKDPDKIVKVTVGSQEWCGNTFKILKKDLEKPEVSLKWNSYFDGEADQTLNLVWEKKDRLHDQLILSLRSLPFKEGYQEVIRLWDSLITSRGKQPTVQKAVVEVEALEQIQTRAGVLPSWKVTVKSQKGTDTYWFEKKSPHMLTKMELHNGQKRILHGRARWSYWDRRIPMPNVLK